MSQKGYVNEKSSRTRDLSASSAVSQPTAPQRASLLYNTGRKPSRCLKCFSKLKEDAHVTIYNHVFRDTGHPGILSYLRLLSVAKTLLGQSLVNKRLEEILRKRSCPNLSVCLDRLAKTTNTSVRTASLRPSSGCNSAPPYMSEVLQPPTTL